MGCDAVGRAQVVRKWALTDRRRFEHERSH